MADSTSRKIIEYVADMRDVFRKLQQLNLANRKVAKTLSTDFTKNLKTVGNSYSKIAKTDTRQLSTGIDDLKNTTASWSQTVKGADGQLAKFTETTKVNAKGVARTTRSFQDLDTNTVSLGQNFARLAKRAALTIPLWLALRGAVTGVISTFKNGIRDIAEFDRRLQKARRNLQGTPQEIESNFKKLRDEVTQLSLRSGKSVEEITDAFQKFATVGLDFETSMTGATEATKLAVTLFGDTTENANSLARAFRVLSDNIDDGRSKSEQLQEVTALLAELWKDQAFEIDELAGALERFAPVASIANFTMTDTIKILAALQTAGIRGTRAGRLLSTATLQLNKNFDKLQTTLGLKINPQLTNTFERLQIVVKEIAKLQKIDELKATQALQELFGGVRGAQIPAALATEWENFVKVLSQTGDIQQFNKDFVDLTNETGILTQRIQNLNKEIGKAFVTGIVGGEDFEDALIKIADTLTDVQTRAEKTGIALRNVITKGPLAGGISAINELIGQEIDKATEDTTDKITNLSQRIVKGLKGELKKAKLSELIAELTEIQIKDIKIGLDKATIQRDIAIFRQQLAELSQVSDDTTLQQKRQLGLTQIEKINKAIINDNIEQLKAQGALTSQIIERRNRLEDLFGINRDLETSLDRQLEKERALREEKRLQAELGNESLKLFRIAREQGVDIAQQISDVLSGEVDFSTFIRRGTEAAEIFKKEFANLFEQQQAKAFFRGETVPGIKGLRGGTRVAIQEEAIRTPALTGRIQARLAQRRAISQQIQSINQVTAPVNITANIDISKLDEVSNKVINQVSQQLPKAGSQINDALKRALVGKQTPTL